MEHTIITNTIELVNDELVGKTNISLVTQDKTLHNEDIAAYLDQEAG